MNLTPIIRHHHGKNKVPKQCHCFNCGKIHRLRARLDPSSAGGKKVCAPRCYKRKKSKNTTIKDGIKGRDSEEFVFRTAEKEFVFKRTNVSSSRLTVDLLSHLVTNFQICTFCQVFRKLPSSTRKHMLQYVTSLALLSGTIFSAT